MHLAAERHAATVLQPVESSMLSSWLGAEPAAGVFRVVPSARRTVPGWNGRPQPLVGVATGPELDGAVVLSVAPTAFTSVATLVEDLAGRGRLADRTELALRLPAALGMLHRPYTEVRLRWTTSPARLPHVGLWRPSDHPGLPGWLRPFGPTVLVAHDRRGHFLAGVGIKRHDELAHELAVGTVEHARGRGLASSLVAQAAARVLADGAIPLYRHDDDNVASSRVADAAGFPDRGWRWLGLADH